MGASPDKKWRHYLRKPPIRPARDPKLRYGEKPSLTRPGNSVLTGFHFELLGRVCARH